MSAQPADAPLLDAALRVDKLPATGRTLKIKTTAEQRVKIAEQLKCESVDKFTATIHATPIKGSIQVEAKLQAVVTQLCVITFQPVSQNIEEEVRRIFLPGTEEDFIGPAGSEVFVDLEGDDLPDYFDDAEADFTGLLLETLALAVDPYPRAPGAEVPQADNPADIGELSPFASLKHLKSTRD